MFYIIKKQTSQWTKKTNCPMASLRGEGPTAQGSQRAQRTRAGAAFASRKQELFIANDAHHKVNTGRATLSAKQNGRSGTIRHAKEGGAPVRERHRPVPTSTAPHLEQNAYHDTLSSCQQPPIYIHLFITLQ